MADDLYRQIILDRYHEPEFRGELVDSDVQITESNPLCGDILTYDLRLDGDRIERVAWRGEGCALSQVSADMLAEKVVGMNVAEVGQLTQEDILAMMGIDPGPARLKCVLLSLACVKKAADRVLSIKK